MGEGNGGFLMATTSDRIAPGTSLLGRKWIERHIQETAPSERDAEDAIELFLDPLCYAVNIKGAPLETWHADFGQVSSFSILLKNKDVGIWRMELRKALDYYITTFPWLQHPYLDWLTVNLLMYAEVAATAHQWASPFMASGEPNWKIGAWLSGLFVAKWAVLLAVFGGALLFSRDFPGAPWIVGGAIVWSQVRKHLLARKRRKVLGTMLEAYKAVGTSTFSWKVLWKHLSQSRALGAYWDPELYALVERRLQGV